MHRCVGEPFAIDGDDIALLGDVTTLSEKILRGIAGIDDEALGAAAACEELANRRTAAMFSNDTVRDAQTMEGLF